MRSSLRGVLCGVLLCACGGRVNDDGGAGPHATAPPDAGVARFSGTGGMTASPTPSWAGAPVSAPPSGQGSTGIGIGAIPIADAAPPPPRTLPPVKPPPPTSPPIGVKPPPPTTMPPAPGDSADAGVPPSYVFGGMYEDGRVVAAFWDGSREPAVLVDPKTGVSTVVGYLGNLRYWQSQLVYDGRTNLLYALGSDANDEQYVYTLTLETGSVRTVHQAPPPQSDGPMGYAAGGMTGDGLLVVGYWTGAREVIALLDPATGDAKDVGTLSGVYSLSSYRLAYDDAKRMVYALGVDQNNTQQVYSLALDTGKAQTVNLQTMFNLVLGAVAPNAQLVVAYWNDPAQREEVGLMDPVTGKVTLAGVLDGLHWWSDQMTYGSGRVVAYGQGEDTSAPWQFYETRIAQ